MIALIVIGILILLSVLLVNVPVTAHIKFYGGRLKIAVNYLGIGILPRKKRKKPGKKRKRSRLPSPKKSSLEEDEEIFEDIAEIGFEDGSNAGSELESGFDEGAFEEGDKEKPGNEQENISGEEIVRGGYSTEASGEKNAEISMDNPKDISENSEKNLTENSKEFEDNSETVSENSEENLTENSEKFEDNSEAVSENSEENQAENSEDISENSKENLMENSGDISENSEENPAENSEKIKKNPKEKSSEKKSGKISAGKKASGKSDGESNDGEPKKPLGERLSELLENIEKKKNAAMLLWELCGGHIKKLLGKLTVDGLVVDFAAADEDAARAALAYGKLSAAFYNLLGVVMGLTRVRVKSVSIDCLYNTPSEKARYDGEFKVRLRPASVLNALIGIMFGYILGGKKYKPALEEFMGGKDG